MWAFCRPREYINILTGNLYGSNVVEWEEMKTLEALLRVDKAYWWLKFDTFLPVDWFFMPCHFPQFLCGWNLLINNDKHFLLWNLKDFPIYSIHYVSWFWVSAKQRQKLLFPTHTHSRKFHSQKKIIHKRLTFCQTKFKLFNSIYLWDFIFEE